ncbi:transporter substrate-binding domain-containing protein [Bartonella doshiae]|uniref:Histidine-binding periplasmic protein n=2 Tax=Bartonella doshiae TaxID=33044 RepID=A0A380ZF41_BARDO|nr:transporter substrate-binding domain-containing protein [Bartonella doshiae]EJF81798.1 lysine-arginine-ornithine-binding periplasmic protein [Bartonella doshiae NCTC 12862 = ATCC 700133]MBB6159764.1 polar amino acid transport system substrate-binding protein [Bartonella doshiae]SUV44775.1 Histidine-binding periplasmic protein precursor [Bartonella doshiae]
MKLLAVALITSATLFIQSTHAQTLKIASDASYPPFSYIDSNNELQGFDIDISYALCKKMNVECTIVTQAFEGMIPGLLAKKYDAVVSSLAPTQERLQKIDFTDPYYNTALAVLVTKDSEIKEISAQAFKDKNLGVQSNTTQAAYAEDHYAPEGVNIKLYPTAIEVNRDLLSHRLDLMISDKIQALNWLESEGKDCCKLLGTLEEMNFPIAIALRKNNNDLKNKLNAAIKEIRLDGTYDKIMKKYFTFNIY